MAHDLEMPMVHEVRDVVPAAGEVVVDAEDVVSFLQQPLAKMRAEKTGTSRDQNPFLQLNLLACGGPLIRQSAAAPD